MRRRWQSSPHPHATMTACSGLPRSIEFPFGFLVILGIELLDANEYLTSILSGAPIA